MVLTLLMVVILIVSYALMFALVRFSENIIRRSERAAESSSAPKAGTAIQSER